MKRIVPFAILLLLLLSCKSEPKKLPDEFKDTELRLISFLNKKVRLPSEYKVLTIEQLLTLMDQERLPDELVQLQFERLKSMQSSGTKFELFVDDFNFLNTITFTAGEYIPLHKEMVNPFVHQLENQILSQLEAEGIEHKRLETKFLTYSKTKVIKVKYMQSNGVQERYITQYVITSGLNTFSMVVINNDNIDFQYVLKNFRSGV